MRPTWRIAESQDLGTTMTDEEARDIVMALVHTVERQPELSDDGLIEALAGCGMNRQDAKLAVAFVPTAFARVAYMKPDSPIFPKIFEAKDRRGHWIAYWLASQPVYRAAALVAVQTAVHGFLTKEQYTRVAGRSAELGAVSNALCAGSEIRGGVFSPVALIGVSAEEIGKQGRVRCWERWMGRA